MSDSPVFFPTSAVLSSLQASLSAACAMEAPTIPGILAKCTWSGSDGAQVIVVLADAQHAQITYNPFEKLGTPVPGFGFKGCRGQGSDFWPWIGLFRHYRRFQGWIRCHGCPQVRDGGS